MVAHPRFCSTIAVNFFLSFELKMRAGPQGCKNLTACWQVKFNWTCQEDQSYEYRQVAQKQFQKLATSEAASSGLGQTSEIWYSATGNEGEIRRGATPRGTRRADLRGPAPSAALRGGGGLAGAISVNGCQRRSWHEQSTRVDCFGRKLDHIVH